MTEVKFDPGLSGSPLWRLIAPEYRDGGEAGGTCWVEGCGRRGTLTCGGCQEARYCSKEHQREHWKVHRPQCRPFKVVRAPGVGRHLVATRDINPGEIILEEPPVTGGPRQYTAPVCLGCHRQVSLTGYRCSTCQWPLCGPDCELRPLHTAECRVFSQANIRPTPLKRKNGLAMEPEMEVEHPIYECVTPLRVCLSLLVKPENWAVVQSMETHREERKMLENQVHNQHNIARFLMEHVKLADHIPQITEESIIMANDVLDVNSFEIRGPGSGSSLRGLYPLTAMMNSSCCPNTQNSIDTDWRCRVRAVRRIRKGEEICDTYTATLSNTASRRKSLKETKYFYCGCARCADPSELGSHFSTLVCRVQDCGGYILCQDPLQLNSAWECLKCHTQMSAQDVAEEQDQWEEKIENTPRTLADQENLLAELLKVYHPHHNMCVDVYFNMIPLFGHSSRETLIEEAERKLELVEKVFSVMDKVIPGLFRMRGMFLVERYTAHLFLLRSKLESKQISKSTFVRKLAGFRSSLEEARMILSFEPEGSIESSRLESVRTFIKQLDNVVADAGKTLIQ